MKHTHDCRFPIRRWLAGVATCLALTSTAALADDVKAAAPAARSAVATWSKRDRTSYSIGAQTGRTLRTADGAEVNLDALFAGLRDGVEGKRLAISEKEMQALLQDFQQMLRQKMAATRGRAIALNRQKAAEFFKSNQTKPGVVSLASGVQYRIIASGNGAHPQEADMVTVAYRGTTLDGREFDATEPGRPAHFKLAGLIAGWKEALKLMPVGSHWELFIPPQLAYGERGVGADIGPNQALVFDVELLATQAADTGE